MDGAVLVGLRAAHRTLENDQGKATPLKMMVVVAMNMTVVMMMVMDMLCVYIAAALLPGCPPPVSPAAAGLQLHVEQRPPAHEPPLQLQRQPHPALRQLSHEVLGRHNQSWHRLRPRGR